MYSANSDAYDPCTIPHPSPPSTVTLGEYAVTGWGSWSKNNVGDSENENPRLADPDNLNFTLKDESPAIDAIAIESVAYQHLQNLYGLAIRCDYLGNLRRPGNMDIGATEGGVSILVVRPNPPVLLFE